MQDLTDVYLAITGLALTTAGCVCILLRILAVTCSIIDDDYVDLEQR
jgi:hypothetical protein